VTRTCSIEVHAPPCCAAHKIWLMRSDSCILGPNQAHQVLLGASPRPGSRWSSPGCRHDLRCLPNLDTTGQDRRSSVLTDWWFLVLIVEPAGLSLRRRRVSSDPVIAIRQLKYIFSVGGSPGDPMTWEIRTSSLSTSFHLLQVLLPLRSTPLGTADCIEWKGSSSSASGVFLWALPFQEGLEGRYYSFEQGRSSPSS
jgi:hypothetical protein